MGWAGCTVLLYLVLFSITVPANGYLTVNSSTASWTNREPVGDLLKTDAVIILASRSSGDPDYGHACFCGFFCNQTCNSSRFATFLLNDDPQVLWSANSKNAVSINVTLKLNSERDLVLQDADGTVAWSTNISNKSVAAISLTDKCNLMLLDEIMLQFGSLLITNLGQLTRCFVGKIWCQDSNSQVKEDCFRSLLPLEGCLLISILILPYAIGIIDHIFMTLSVTFNLLIKA